MNYLNEEMINKFINNENKGSILNIASENLSHLIDTVIISLESNK